MRKQFKSKVSYILLIVVFCAFYTLPIVEVINNGLTIDSLEPVGALTLIYAFIVYLFFSAVYTIDNGFLIIKLGFVYNKKIGINRIKSIKRTKNPISSPAPSFDRIEVCFDKYNSIIVSPKDKVGFVRELKNINPKIESDI